MSWSRNIVFLNAAWRLLEKGSWRSGRWRESLGLAETVCTLHALRVRQTPLLEVASADLLARVPDWRRTDLWMQPVWPPASHWAARRSTGCGQTSRSCRLHRLLQSWEHRPHLFRKGFIYTSVLHNLLESKTLHTYFFGDDPHPIAYRKVIVERSVIAASWSFGFVLLQVFFNSPIVAELQYIYRLFNVGVEGTPERTACIRTDSAAAHLLWALAWSGIRGAWRWLRVAWCRAFCSHSKHARCAHTVAFRSWLRVLERPSSWRTWWTAGWQRSRRHAFKRLRLGCVCQRTHALAGTHTCLLNCMLKSHWLSRPCCTCTVLWTHTRYVNSDRAVSRAPSTGSTQQRPLLC